MKNLLLLAIVAIIGIGSGIAQEEAHVNWVKLDKAQELNKKDAKFTIIDMYTPWCGPCRMMEKGTFSDPSVVKYINEHFYAVKFNAEGPDPVMYNGKEYKNTGYDASRGNGRNSTHELTRKFAVPGYPTIVVLDTKGEVKQSIIGYKTVEQFLAIIKEIEK